MAKAKREAQPPIQVTEGWYIPKPRGDEVDPPPPRWVLSVGNDHVYYSRGGDSHLECSVETMRRWIKRYRARRPVEGK